MVDKCVRRCGVPTPVHAADGSLCVTPCAVALSRFSFRLACVLYGTIVLLCGVALVIAKLKWPNTFLVARARAMSTSIASTDADVGYGTPSPKVTSRAATREADMRTHLLSGMVDA